MFPQIDKKKMGQQLKRIMKERKVTPKEVQQFLGLSCVQTIYRWLEGVNIPCVDHLYALSILLDVTINEIVAGNIWNSRMCRRFARSDCGSLFLFADYSIQKEDNRQKEAAKGAVYELERWKDTSLIRLKLIYGTAERLLAA